MRKKVTSLTLRSALYAICSLGVMILTLYASAEAQQANKMARIGYLSAQSGPPPTLVAFKEG